MTKKTHRSIIIVLPEKYFHMPKNIKSTEHDLKSKVTNQETRIKKIKGFCSNPCGKSDFDETDENPSILF